jgi:hypothetical protein
VWISIFYLGAINNIDIQETGFVRLLLDGGLAALNKKCCAGYAGD